MFAMKLSERYFKFYGIPLIEEKFPEFKNSIAAGLVGEGSECYGYDDSISRDHDWGPGFCLWLNKIDFDNIGEELQAEYEKLPRSFAGIAVRQETKEGKGRLGVFEIGQFYKRFIGTDVPPSSWDEWIKIPETYLSVCTNGKIFQDTLGEFTFFREKLLHFYPEDVRLKLIASRCILIGREGQYNFSRSIKRGEFTAAHYSLSIFIRAVISLTFLLNYKYRPFYKWMHKAVRNLPILGHEIFDLIQKLVLTGSINLSGSLAEKQETIIERTCILLVKELRKQQLTKAKSNFLLDHSYAVEENIYNEDIKKYRVAETYLY